MSKIKIAVFISGGGSNLQALINEIELGAIPAEIALIISNRSNAYGLTRGKAHGIKTVVIDKKAYQGAEEASSDMLMLLQGAEIDLIVLAGFLEMIPGDIVQKYRNRIINIHPSLIPSFSGKGYYGERVHEAAHNRGVRISGATVHFVNEETDGGPIILQDTVNIDFEDTPKAIQEKVLKLEHRLLPLAVKLFAEGRLKVVKNRVQILSEVQL